MTTRLWSEVKVTLPLAIILAPWLGKKTKPQGLIQSFLVEIQTVFAGRGPVSEGASLTRRGPTTQPALVGTLEKHRRVSQSSLVVPKIQRKDGIPLLRASRPKLQKITRLYP